MNIFRNLSFFRIIIGYAASIIFFGFIYWIFWFFKPDSFIFNEEFNLHPISSTKIIGDTNINLKNIQTKADSLRKQSAFYSKKIYQNQRKSDSLKQILIYKGDLVEKKTTKNINEWRVAQRDSTLLRKKELLQKKIEELKKTYNNNLTKSQLELELAKLELDISKKETNSLEYITENFDFFIDQNLSKDITKTDSLYSLLEFKELPKLQSKKEKIDFSIENMRSELLNKSMDRITLIDFLLFSASNSTTITFGEMTPNSLTMKILLLIQGFICLFIVAIFGDKLINKINTP